MPLPRRLLTYLRQPMIAGLAAILLLTGSPVAAKDTLPKPHVSPALDAVLLPITAAVRKEFKLGKKAAGAVVVSVEPNGTAELYGLEPGDVITELNDKIIRRPVDIDSMIKYGLNDGRNYFFFEGTRKNRAKKTIIELYDEDYAKPVSVADVGRWRGYNTGGARGARGNGYRGDDGYFYSGGGFYYADFCDAYYDDFYEVYDYTLIYVEEVIITEVYITSIESDETVFYYDETLTGYDWPDEYYISEVDDYVYSDEFYAEYSSDEVYYEDEAYDPETGLSYEDAAALGYIDESEGYGQESYGEEYVEEPSFGEDYVEEPVYDDQQGYEEPVYDDQAVYDDQVYEDQYVEEPVYDDQYVEEPVYEDQYVEEPVYDDQYVEEPVYEEQYVEEPVYEEQYVEEPVYEEPYYEEPVYEEQYVEEPVYEEPYYEEPVYDGGGGGCTYDDYGNEYC